VADLIPDRVLADGDSLCQEGRSAEAIALLTDANRHHRDADLEVRLVRMRADDFAASPPTSPPSPWPTPQRDLFSGLVGPPEIAAADLDLEVLSSALEHHGCLLVRGLIPPARVDLLVDDIDHTMAALRRVMEGAPPKSEAPWFLPFEVDGNDLGGAGRFWAAAGGTVWAAESPRSFFDLVETFDEIGVRQLLTEYFHEPAVLSVVKTSLRRLPPDAPGGWHQDAYVYGLDTRTVNVWAALSPCGPAVSPGLDIVPRKFHDLAEQLPPPPPLHTVSQATIDALDRETPVCRPAFEPGDALLFDSLFLHQTGTGPGFTEVRYGIESWFFAASTVPPEWVPLTY
jgi:hypothetical protein